MRFENYEREPRRTTMQERSSMKIMIMNRTETLQKERDKVLISLAENKGNRAKWLIVLMDIDDEMEEMAQNKHKTN